MAKRKYAKRDICQDITTGIIEQLENGVAPWRCPMEQGEGIVSIPMNASTGADYSGMNIINFLIATIWEGRKSNKWVTYKQAQALGGQVRKGEKGTTGIFYKTLEVDSKRYVDEAGEPVKEIIPMIKAFKVFNLDQVDGLDELREDNQERRRFDFTPIEAGEKLMAQCGIKINKGGRDAFYRPSTDEITMPDADRFENEEDYYAVFAHELTHATKKKSRCDRVNSHDLKDRAEREKAYAFEELVAELGSCFVCAHIGLPQPLNNHAAYLDGWLQALRDDKRFIFKAAAKAQEATDWILQKLEKNKVAA